MKKKFLLNNRDAIFDAIKRFIFHTEEGFTLCGNSLYKIAIKLEKLLECLYIGVYMLISKLMKIQV